MKKIVRKLYFKIGDVFWMKSKIFRPMAVALTMAVGIGTTAMAASVVTSTNYTYGATNNPTVTVTTNVTAARDSQVTFLVSKGDLSTNEGQIIYIDQAGANENGVVSTFTFTAAQDTLYDANVTAKFGTDGNDKAFPIFHFNEGVDYLTNATASVETVKDVTLDETEGLTAVAKYAGNVTKYGFTLKQGDTVLGELPAYASKDGIFAIQVKGLTGSGYTLEPYAR